MSASLAYNQWMQVNRGVIWASLMITASLHAQTQPPTLEFTFVNPGARSLGFGGAFASLADDATAAVANPAGLVQITRPEVSVEARGWGNILGAGTTRASGIETSFDYATWNGVGFVSFVYPRGDWSFAVYRHQVVNVASVSGVRGVIESAPGGGVPGFVEAATTASFDLVTYGFATGHRLTEKLEIGVGFTYFDGTLQSLTGFSYFPGTTEALRGNRTVTVVGGDWGISVGAIYHISPRVNLGGFYRQAPSFRARAEELRAGAPEAFESVETKEGKARFPDVFGAGIVYRSESGSMTASAEWDHIRYSLAGGGIFEDVEVEDGDEVHVGIEYAFLGITPIIALRAGAWRERGRRVRFVEDSVLAGVALQGADRLHVAFGAGVAIPHFQVDLGVDLSKFAVMASLSAIVSF